MPYTPNRRQIPRRMDSMPTPVAIQLHDQPDRTVAEASVTVVKRPFGFNPVSGSISSDSRAKGLLCHKNRLSPPMSPPNHGPVTSIVLADGFEEHQRVVDLLPFLKANAKSSCLKLMVDSEGCDSTTELLPLVPFRFSHAPSCWLGIVIRSKLCCLSRIK